MNGAVSLTRGTRHDRHTSIQQIFPCHVQIGMSVSEDSRKQTLQTSIDFVEGLLEPGSGFLIDLANRILQRRQSPLQIFILFVQIDFPFRLRLVFINCSQINRAQALYAITQFFQGLLALCLSQRVG